MHSELPPFQQESQGVWAPKGDLELTAARICFFLEELLTMGSYTPEIRPPQLEHVVFCAQRIVNRHNQGRLIDPSDIFVVEQGANMDTLTGRVNTSALRAHERSILHFAHEAIAKTRATVQQRTQ